MPLALTQDVGDEAAAVAYTAAGPLNRQCVNGLIRSGEDGLTQRAFRARKRPK
jgi:hypothetical protein